MNISKIHYDNAKNNEIMRFNNVDHIPLDEEVKDISNFIRDRNSKMRIRMSCILTDGYIDSISKIKSYVDHYYEYGIDDFVFRDLMVYDEKTVNDDIKRFYSDSRIDLYDMYKDFDNDSSFSPFLNILGYYYYTEIYKYKRCTVSTEKADLQKEYDVFKKNENNIYEMVFHPNGNLCSTWNNDEGVIEL